MEPLIGDATSTRPVATIAWYAWIESGQAQPPGVDAKVES